MIFYFALIIVFASVAVFSWRRHHDVLHPNLFFPPLFIFLYGVMPMALLKSDRDRFTQFAGDGLLFYQLLTIILPLLLMLGVWLGSRGSPKIYKPEYDPLRVTNSKRLWQIGLGAGLLGAIVWLAGVQNAGGFTGAYGTSYGGGKLQSGYARELRNIGLLGVLLVFTSRRGCGMRSIDWAVIAICISPTILHGILGARRGPTFIAAVVVGAGYYFLLGRRINFVALTIGGLSVGFLMLFLVANRSNIYIGSDVSEIKSGFDFLVRWESNEYLIGNAVVQYTQVEGGFYGLRQLAHLLGRLIPTAIWPTVYEDLTNLFGLDINLKKNAGVDAVAVAQIAVFQPTLGSAMAFVGAVWLEFQYAAPFVVLAIGWFYGRTWKKAEISPRTRVFHVLLSAMSVYLVMQDTDAWFYRVVMFFITTSVIFPRTRRRKIVFKRGHAR